MNILSWGKLMGPRDRPARGKSAPFLGKLCFLAFCADCGSPGNAECEASVIAVLRGRIRKDRFDLGRSSTSFMGRAAAGGAQWEEVGNDKGQNGIYFGKWIEMDLEKPPQKMFFLTWGTNFV